MLGSRMSRKKRVVLIVIIVIVLVLVALGVGGWTYHAQPRFCSDLCHIMSPYLESWNGSDYGAGVHSAEGVTCLDCHEPTIGEQMNELLVFVKGDYTVPLEELEVSDEFCYDCHLSDEPENKECGLHDAGVRFIVVYIARRWEHRLAGAIFHLGHLALRELVGLLLGVPESRQQQILQHFAVRVLEHRHQAPLNVPGSARG